MNDRSDIYKSYINTTERLYRCDVYDRFFDHLYEEIFEYDKIIEKKTIHSPDGFWVW